MEDRRKDGNVNSKDRQGLGDSLRAVKGPRGRQEKRWECNFKGWTGVWRFPEDSERTQWKTGEKMVN